MTYIPETEEYIEMLAEALIEAHEIDITVEDLAEGYAYNDEEE